MDKELNSLIGMELKSQMLDSRNDIQRTNKLVNGTKITISLNELNNSGNLRQGSRIHCLEKCCFLKDVNNSAYCSEIWPTN